MRGKRDHIAIWTDGATEPNPGPGAYAAHIIWTNSRVTELDGFDPETTNNRMELMGPIVALEHVRKQRGRIIVFSDSKYVISGISDWIFKWKARGWRNKRHRPVANRDLWERLFAATVPLRSRLDWQWVRGHAGVPGNERADFLARRRLLSELQPDREAFQAAVRGFSRHQDFDPGPYLQPFERKQQSHQRGDALLKPNRKAVRTEVTTDEFFGGCPLCGQNDALLHVGLGHWSVCREHQTRWDVGSMYKFAAGKDEELWTRNAKELIACRVVDPILPDRVREERQHMEDAPSWVLEWEAEMGRGRKVIEPMDPNGPEGA